MDFPFDQIRDGFFELIDFRNIEVCDLETGICSVDQELTEAMALRGHHGHVVKINDLEFCGTNE